MSTLSILICLFILGVWLFAAAQHLFSARKVSGRDRLISVLASLFLAVGALGFFGSALSSMGGLNWLPHSFEWPVGSVRGVVETRNHVFVVPHTPSGRIQLYDRNWKFIRGWHVDAGGGTFDVFISEPDSINVVTARGRRHYIYSLDGYSSVPNGTPMIYTIPCRAPAPLTWFRLHLGFGPLRVHSIHGLSPCWAWSCLS